MLKFRDTGVSHRAGNKRSETLGGCGASSHKCWNRSSRCDQPGELVVGHFSPDADHIHLVCHHDLHAENALPRLMMSRDFVPITSPVRRPQTQAFVCPKPVVAQAVKSSRTPTVDQLYASTAVDRPRRGYSVATALPLVWRPAVGGLLVLLSGTALAWTKRAAIFGHVAGAWIGARVRVSELSLRPLQGRVRLRDVRMYDADGRAMFSADHISVRRDAGTEVKSPVYRIGMHNPSVVAVFHNLLCSRSNWSQWASTWGDSATNPSRNGLALGKEANDAFQSDSLEKVKVNVTGALTLSVRSDVLGGRRLMDDVQLTNFDGIGQQLSSAKSIARFVDHLCAQTIQKVSAASIPRNVRAAAKAHAKAVLRAETKGLRALGQVQVRKLRENIRFLDDVVLKRLPDMQQWSEGAAKTREALTMLDGLLNMATTTGPAGDASDDAESDSDDSARSHDRGSRSPQTAGRVSSESGAVSDTTQVQPNVSFFELNEEMDPGRRATGRRPE